MAATNVQAFSGDVEVASNLAVDTNILFVDSVNNKVGIGTTNPDKKLTVAGDMEIGDSDGDYHHLRIGGGNSSGFLYGAFDKYSDGIHMGYNFYNDNTTNQIPNTGGSTSRISMGYGQIQLHTGGVNTEPNNNALCISSDGNVGIGTTTPTGQLEVHGVGQTSQTTFDQAGSMGGVLALRSDDGNEGSGGAVMFGSHAGFHAAIKASLEDGTSNTRGRLAFFIRSATTDPTMSHAMTIDDGGNVGIGTTDPTGGKLHVAGAVYSTSLIAQNTIDGVLTIKNTSTPAVMRVVTNGGQGYIQSGTAPTSDSRADINFTSMYNGTNFMKIKGSTGNVGIGTTVVGARLQVGDGLAPAVNTRDADGSISVYGTGRKKADPGKPGIYHRENVGLGLSSDYEMTFEVAAAAKEAMRILSDGRIIMNGNYVTTYNGVLTIHATNNLKLVDSFVFTAFNDPNVIGWFINSAGAERGSINGLNASSIQYDTSSDERLKKQIKPMQTTLDRVNALKPCTYTWIRDEAKGYGFIAQEVFKVFPEMKPVVPYSGCTCKCGAEICESCTLCEDEHDYPKHKNGTDFYYGLDYGRFTPFLTKAIQELDAKVEEHHNRKSLVTGVEYSSVTEYEGLIVSATTNDYKNGRPVLSLSNTENDKKCYGVILGKAESIDNETNIQKSGDGRMWVVNTRGNMESGDLVTTSGIGGYGKKQDDDILRSHTVAKLTQDCDFTEKLVPIKRIKQELKDVTYYLRDNYVKLPDSQKAKELNAIEREVPVYITNKEVNGTSDDYVRREFMPEISEEEYDALTSKEREVYEVKYIKNQVTTITPYEYNRLTDAEKTLYKEATEIGYYTIEKYESSKPMPKCCGEYTTDIRQELVNVLDDNGQLVWEDDPSGATEPAYEIRYLDADGNITDEANHVYKAAFVGCTYHCG